MITWPPVTWGFLDGVDCGLVLADGLGAVLGAVLGELVPGADDVAGEADDAMSGSSLLQAAAPSDTMPKVAVASRVATFLTESLSGVLAIRGMG
jgi:hypothetical protein